MLNYFVQSYQIALPALKKVILTMTMGRKFDEVRVTSISLSLLRAIPSLFRRKVDLPLFHFAFMYRRPDLNRELNEKTGIC